MKIKFLWLSLVILHSSPSAAQTISIDNEEGLRTECPHRTFDETDRACQVRTLLAELRTVSAELKRQKQLTLEAKSDLEKEICTRFQVLLELYKTRLELEALKSEPEIALRQAENISIVERQIIAANCKRF